MKDNLLDNARMVARQHLHAEIINFDYCCVADYSRTHFFVQVIILRASQLCTVIRTSRSIWYIYNMYYSIVLYMHMYIMYVCTYVHACDSASSRISRIEAMNSFYALALWPQSTHDCLASQLVAQLPPQQPTCLSSQLSKNTKRPHTIASQTTWT